METVKRACPLCQSVEASGILAGANFNEKDFDEFSFASRKFPEYSHYSLYLCRKCDLIYANPIPSLDTLVKRYSKADFDSQQESYFASQTYKRFLPGIMKKLPDTTGVIDIGTGDGAFLRSLIDMGFTKVIGIEPSVDSIKSAGNGVRHLIKQGVFNPNDFDNSQFSLITCFQTLEHLYDPLQMCRDIYDKLKNGGAGFFVCHNHRSLFSRTLGLKSPIIDLEHLQLFSPKSLSLLLKCSGFVDIEIKYFINRYPLYYWIKLFPLPDKFKLFCITVLKKIKIGNLPVSILAGNIAAVGYKKR